MKNNKKGLSTIVATLLIILLTLVAVGIIWLVIRGVVQGGADDVNISSKCLSSEVVVTQVNSAGGDLYDVTLNRKRGTDEIGGVKLVVSDAEELESCPTDILNEDYPLPAQKTTTVQIDLAAMGCAGLVPSKVDVVVFYLNEDTNEQSFCETTSTFQIY